MKIVQMLKRKNLALLVSILTMLAMALAVSCANKGDGESSPVAVTFKTVAAVESDWYAHTLAISTDDKLYAWGRNYYGELGDGTTINRKIPTEIMAGTTFKTVVAGKEHTLAISTDDKLYAWGYNRYGQLGNGTTTNQSTPQLIEVYE